jgi:tRNA (adenine-N(1)-)-methyltransferase non-catalytic subunit
LVIASKYRPLPILKQSLLLLTPSSPFVVFHEFLEPLVDCYNYLVENELAIKLLLSDSWLREFQTLPGRMRPDMYMTTSGGYLLTGIYVGMNVANRTLEVIKEENKKQKTSNEMEI